MNIDASIVAAAIAAFNLVLTMGGGGFFAGKLTGKVQRIETDVRETKGLLVTSAVEADRLRRAEADIDNLEEDLRNLRKGVGYINDGNATGVNREYR
jgi:hypothetical protein